MAPTLQPDARIGVQAAGSISFPATIYEALGCPARVILLHDKANGTVAISAAAEGERGSCAVTRNGTGGASYRVAARALCGQLGLLHSAHRYPARVFGEGIIGVILSEEIAEDW